MTTTKHMERGKEYYSPEYILPLIGKYLPNIILDGDEVSISSTRLRTFSEKGITCTKCGITGQYFVKERTRLNKKQKLLRKKKGYDAFHLNLYAIKDGEEILMTRDHIFPKSRGGTNSITNSQTMCKTCNELKADKVEDN